MAKKLTLAAADAAANAAIKRCLDKRYAPISVTVLDASGAAVVTKRMDGCSCVGYPQFASAKASTAIVMKTTSRDFRDKYTKEPAQVAKYAQMLSMVSITNGGMAPFPGGVAITATAAAAGTESSEVVGAVGVSGAAGDEDEDCAHAGVEAARACLR
jgi:uncharacterized protein GlcG (DUF336 family)